MKTKKLISLLLVVAMLFTFVSVIAACEPDDPNPSDNNPTAITVSPTSVTLDVGEKSSKPTLTFTPSDATNTVTWDSANKSVATVDNDGVITAVAAGTTKVTVTSTVASSVKAEISVTVNEKQVKPDPNKGLTKDNPLTPDEAIALMKEAGSGNVVNATNKEGYYVQGVVNSGSTVDTEFHEWDFTLGTGSEKVTCQAKVDSSVATKPTETNGALDGATVIIKGFLELYSGDYKIAYLPANVSPTGAKFTPSLVDIVIPEADPESVTLDHTEELVLLAGAANKYMDLKATVTPANAPQDIVWSVSENSANITVSNGRISWAETEGEATITATAKDTNKSASVKVKVENVHGSTETDPLTVDEAIELMTEDGKEVFAGYAGNMKQGFYLTGKVDSGSKYQQGASGQNSYWTFTMSRSSNKVLSCTMGSVSGVSGADGVLDGYTVLMRNVYLTLTDLTYNAGSLNDLAINVTATRPALTGIQIDESANVDIGGSVHLQATPVPANALLDGIEWHSSADSKATVTNGIVVGVAAGTTEITATVGEITSNKCTVTVTGQEVNSIVFDWTDGLASDQVVSQLYNFEIEFVDMMTFINTWSSGQTEITSFIAEGCMTVTDASEGKGFMFDSASAFIDCGVTIGTTHDITKVILKIIPLASATTVQFSVNGVSRSVDKGSSNWDGKVDSAIDIEIPLNSASKILSLAASMSTSGNGFAVVGMTFEW